jgi:hypothetical protein
MKAMTGLFLGAMVLLTAIAGAALEPSTRPAEPGVEKTQSAKGQVEGTVLNEDGSPGAKLLVRIFRGSDFDPKNAKRLYKKNLAKGDLQPVSEAISKGDGSFILSSLEPGDYIVVVADRKASCAAESTVVVKDSTPISVKLELKKVELKPDKKPKD